MTALLFSLKKFVCASSSFRVEMAKERGKGMTVFGILLAYILLGNTGGVDGTTDQADTSCLNVLFSSLNSPSQLRGWVPSGGDPCGESWFGVICTGSAVTSIKLPDLGLTGTLGYNMASMISLTEFDMSNNNLGGGNSIPYSLPPNLQKLNLGSNQFGSNIPYSISQMVPLKYLNLAHNQLQGNLSDMFGSLTNLSTMDLSFNQLTGNLPESFGSLSSLTTLHLENNQFTGQIDVLANLPLQDLNLANNHFTGWIPDKLKNINNLRTDGNTFNLSPAPTPPPYSPPPYSPPPGRKINPREQYGGNNQSSGGGGGSNSGIGTGGIAGVIASILLISIVAAIFLVRRKLQKSSRENTLGKEQHFAHHPSDVAKETKTIHKSSMLHMATMPQPPHGSLKPPPVEQHRSFDGDEFSNKPIMRKDDRTSIKASVYSVADLQIATESFSIHNLIGEGSFGRVYKAEFGDGKVMAVKKINSSALPNHSPDDFIELVSNISCLHHPNLSELVGYCSQYGQYLLVYEYYNNGSLHDILHLSDEYSNPLSWTARVKIALGTARALEYLHEVCSPSIVHRNFNSSKILLDAELNPHLSDCGFENLAPDEEFQALEQKFSTVYNPPELSTSGDYTLKSDVYNFGIVMLELLTGKKPFDRSRPRPEQSLIQWAAPRLHDIDALDRMVDPALKGLYPAKSLSRFADVIALCVQSEPEFRPPMSEVVQALVRLVQRANRAREY
ncbi:protein STRUBBELIG-RECEPTOR FAMILY 6-like [Canna indica]|uniref:Protein STRUBBELIG-RECEPTOR FAMILY 6-like n=1 Tax=Canna indica TaxID=4628 RepID=A0AAQ3JRQ1_9LILI|nr:protein STRUBBELIG-RECEPTOR FAMILY 6-like [Canna indica]